MADAEPNLKDRLLNELSSSITPSGDEPTTAVPAVPPSIPDHILLRVIGKGSYGEVWLARNIMGTPRAVKIVHRRAFDSDRPYEREFAGIRRFEPVSRLHPSQLNVLHVGRDDAASYFFYVMELADDVTEYPLTRPSDTLSPIEGEGQGEGAGAPRSAETYTPRSLRSDLQRRGRLPCDECLNIGLALATALDHLHRHGLVHRDIKPSNIVFVNGIPKLADIGLVTHLEATLSFVGTLGYLPPEGPGTPQADIFSLGKVLYEMATGRDRQDYPELPTNLIEVPAADRAALAELNEVIIKACHADAKQRYQTAAELHADLALLQSGKSVSHVRTIERRVRTLTRAGLVIAIMTVLAGGAWFYQTQQTRRVKKLAAENLKLAQQAQASQRKAETEASRSRQAAQFLNTMLAGVGPSAALGRDTTLLREILDQTATRLDHDLKEEPQVEAELRNTLGTVYRDLGDYEKSEAMLREALTIRQRLGDRVSESLLELARTLSSNYERAETEALYRLPSATLGPKLVEAESLARRAVAMNRKLRGDEHRDVAEALRVLAGAMYYQAKFSEAEQCGRQALAIAREVLSDDDQITLLILNVLAMALGDLGKLPEAEALHREAIAVMRQRLGETHPDLSASLQNLGLVVKRQGRLAEAESLLTEAVAIERKLARADSRYLAGLLNELADTLGQQAKFAEAEAAFREALDLKIKLYGEEHLEVAAVMDNFGGLLIDEGKLAEAEPLLDQALAMRKKLVGDDHPHIVGSLQNLANLRRRQGRLAETESFLRGAIGIARQLPLDQRSYAPELPGSSRLVPMLENLAFLVRQQGRTDEAETALREALEYLRKPTASGLPPQTPALGKVLHHLAELLANRKALAEARLLAEEAMELYRRYPQWPANERQHASSVLKNVLLVGDSAAAESLCRERLQDLRNTAPADSGTLASAVAELAIALLANQKFIEAEPLARECLEIRERTIPDDWRTFNSRSLLGGSLLGRKEYTEAESLLLAGYEGMKQRENKISAQARPRLKETLERLVQLYEETNRPDEAAKWKQELAEFDPTESK